MASFHDSERGCFSNGKTVIVSFDLGITNSTIAYTYNADPRDICVCPCTISWEGRRSVPTAVMINSCDSWEVGVVAETKYDEMLMAHIPGEPLQGHLYRGFLLHLKDKAAGLETLMAVSLTGKRVGLFDVVVKYLTGLKDQALHHLSYEWGETISARDVQWVITVPGTWTEFAKSFVRTAAFRAGLIDEEQADSLILAMAPEAAALGMLCTNHVAGVPPVEAGQRFLVIHGDGGLTEVAGYEVLSAEPLQIKALSTPTGGAWGTRSVAAEFRAFLQELLGDALYCPAEMPYEFHCIEQMFHRCLLQFDGVGQPGHLSMNDVLETKRQLMELAEAYNLLHPAIIINKPARVGHLSMSKELMLSFYEPSLRAMVQEIRRALSEVPNITRIYLTGEFGHDQVVAARLRAEFPAEVEKGVEVVVVPTMLYGQENCAAARGAVLFGQNPGVVASRPSPYTYGVAAHRDDEHAHFHVLVHKGQELPHDHQCEVAALPVTCDPRPLQWRIYRSDLVAPTTVRGETLMGAVTGNMPMAPTREGRILTLVCRFGGPEIRVSVRNAAGEVHQAAIEMR